MNFVHQIRGRTSHQMPYITYQQSNEIDEAIDAIVKSIETLDGDIRRVGREHSQSQTMLQSISEKLPTLAQSINEQNTFVDSLGPYQINLEQDIQLMKQAFNGLNAMSYDGTYIWRITDVHEKMRKLIYKYFHGKRKYVFFNIPFKLLLNLVQKHRFILHHFILHRLVINVVFVFI